jgi:hypothetical protein
VNKELIVYRQSWKLLERSSSETQQNPAADKGCLCLGRCGHDLRDGADDRGDKVHMTSSESQSLLQVRPW